MTCDACGAAIPDSIGWILKRLVSVGLGAERKAALATMYGGTAPEVLCWECFAPAVQVLNGVQQ